MEVVDRSKSPIKVCMVTLGCSKNLVDAECMTGILTESGYQPVSEPQEAQVIIVNTCGFIESAKQEAIDTILTMADFKADSGQCDFLVVTGCLAQRYEKDIFDSLPEVDLVVGTAHYHNIAKGIDRLYGGEVQGLDSLVEGPGSLEHLKYRRQVSTQGYAWLKIAEGCSNCCAYCAIPQIRGRYQSRPMEEILSEAKELVSSGSRELILTAQDTTSYGIDLYGEPRLPQLLRELSELEELKLIRIMYAYSDGISEELIAEIAGNPKVAHYLDLPIQHADDNVLKRMNRRDTSASIAEQLAHLRQAIPDIILRTTVLVGFPGEDEAAFNNLLDSLREWKFDRLGGFVFSPEEGTAAFTMGDVVDKAVANRRLDTLMSLQEEIASAQNQKRLDTVTEVMIESISDDGIFYVGRSYGEAPEVDPVIFVIAKEAPLSIGEVCRVKIIDCTAYDLTGETVT